MYCPSIQDRKGKKNIKKFPKVQLGISLGVALYSAGGAAIARENNSVLLMAPARALCSGATCSPVR